MKLRLKAIRLRKAKRGSNCYRTQAVTAEKLTQRKYRCTLESGNLILWVQTAPTISNFPFKLRSKAVRLRKAKQGYNPVIAYSHRIRHTHPVQYEQKHPRWAGQTPTANPGLHERSDDLPIRIAPRAQPHGYPSENKRHFCGCGISRFR